MIVRSFLYNIKGRDTNPAFYVIKSKIYIHALINNIS